jgi:hypothetical protein
MFSGFYFSFIFSRALFCVKAIRHFYTYSFSPALNSAIVVVGYMYIGSAVYPRNDRPGFVPFRLAYEFTQIIGGKKSFIRICVCTVFFFL